MAMLADSVELVIGVDTHKHTHTAAVLVAATGQTLASLTVATTPDGYQQLLELADQHQAPAGVGDRRHRRLRRRTDPVPSWPPGTSCGAGPAQADRPPPRRQVRPPRRHPGGPRGAGPRPARPAPRHRPPRSVVGAADRPSLSGPGRRRRPTPTPGPGGRRPRHPPRTPPQPHHTPPGQVRRRSDSRPPGMSRPPPLRPACVPWPAASKSWTPRSPSTHGPSPSSCGPGGRTCSPAAAWARSWPPSCCAPGPIPAAAPATPPSPCSAGPPPSRPPAARRSGFDSTGPATVNSTRPYTWSLDQAAHRPGDARLRHPPTRSGQDQPRNPTLPGPLRRPPALPTPRGPTSGFDAT